MQPTQHPASESPTVLHGPLDAPRDLGDINSELQAAARGLFFTQLSQFALLEFSGDDAAAFLQGQLSCDVDALRHSDRSSLGAYCTAKGRILATFVLWEQSGVWRMMLSRSQAPAIQKRLGMFVMRAKVHIRLAEDWVLIGIAGSLPASLTHLASHDPWRQRSDDDVTVVSLPGKRSLICVPRTAADDIQISLNKTMPKTGTAAWEWTEIRNGIPWITAATQDQFVPQMVNLELIGGVNFKKGCYPGQEIVARTQYLGKVKRRMYLAHVPSSFPAVAGQVVHSDNVGGQVNGMVVNAESSPSGGVDLLVSVQSESVSTSRVHLESAEGPALEFMALPYSLS